MKKAILTFVVLSVSLSAYAKDPRKKLTAKMAKVCKYELTQEPTLTDDSDGDAIWKNLEDKKNNKKMPLSKKCANAHEAYKEKVMKQN